MTNDSFGLLEHEQTDFPCCERPEGCIEELMDAADARRAEIDQ